MRLDLATIFGLLLGFSLVAAAIAWGGNIQGFFDLPSLLIVLGGTLGVTMICFPFKEFIRARAYPPCLGQPALPSRRCR